MMCRPFFIIMAEIQVRGTKKEQKLFTEVYRHYIMAEEDLNARIPDWNTKDELFWSYIDDTNWPYSAEVFDPRVFTAIFEKTSRLFANKPRGRMVPREGGDALGARINNELLRFQWDEAERINQMPMLARWAMMDMNARKYGASFAICKWHYETRNKRRNGKIEKYVYFDGPDFKPLINRDCLPNPSYSTIKGWFQHRDYVTIEELTRINDVARGKPVYKNLDALKEQIRKQQDGKKTIGGDSRNSNWQSKTKEIKGLTDYLGKDEYNQVIEIVTEYSNDSWVTFAPKHGIILRDIPNPYDHGQIPVVMLRYYPVDDDLYGMSEIEPVEKLQKATNALICQYLDAVNMGLNPIAKIRTTGVQMHTIQWAPGAKWLMNDPASDVVPFETGIAGVSEFTSTYRFIVGAMQEALGETSQGISNLVPGESSKTATEIRDSALQRNARDNFNQIFLTEALKRQMMLWHSMNQQFLFSDEAEQAKIIRIVGKDAIRYFESRGLKDMALSPEAEELLSDPNLADIDVKPEELMMPMYPVNLNGNVLPKFTVEESGEVGHLIIEPDDISGNYDYIPDIESMSVPDDAQLLAVQKQMIETALDEKAQMMLANQGYRLKFKELLEDFFEQLGKKDADKYFEKIQEGELNVPGQLNQGGAGGIDQSQLGGGNVPNQGLAGGGQAVSGGQNQPLMAGPAGG